MYIRAGAVGFEGSDCTSVGVESSEDGVVVKSISSDVSEPTELARS